MYTYIYIYIYTYMYVYTITCSVALSKGLSLSQSVCTEMSSGMFQSVDTFQWILSTSACSSSCGKVGM